MDEAKYVCEPHYDENGNFDYWNPLFPHKRDTCKGCEREFYDPLFVCDECARRFEDAYEPKVAGD